MSVGRRNSSTALKALSVDSSFWYAQLSRNNSLSDQSMVSSSQKQNTGAYVRENVTPVELINSEFMRGRNTPLLERNKSQQPANDRRRMLMSQDARSLNIEARRDRSLLSEGSDDS